MLRVLGAAHLVGIAFSPLIIESPLLALPTTAGILPYPAYPVIDPSELPPNRPAPSMPQDNQPSPDKGPKNPRRRYSEKTIKVLFALSGDQCAFPNCTNHVIIPETDESDAYVSNQICHIHSIAPDGPRGRSNLTSKQLNEPANLILFCPTHHGIVDGQHESYPPELLRKWKKEHEEHVRNRISPPKINIEGYTSSIPNFPVELIDQKITEDLSRIRKSRFYQEFNTAKESISLGTRITSGDLSGGSNATRSKTLGWCSRFLTQTENAEYSLNFLETAKRLGHPPEVTIAEAFLASKTVSREAGLRILAPLETPSAKSAALMLVSHHDGPDGALKWLNQSGLNYGDLDPDGKLFLWSIQFELFHWEECKLYVSHTEAGAISQTPALYHMIAMSHLLDTVPDEYRSIVLNQLPFETDTFPLSSDSTALESRRKARDNFTKSASIAGELGVRGMEERENLYALWLDLRDPQKHEDGIRHLESQLRESKTALRVIPLALQFGVRVDLDATTREIDRLTALNGGPTEASSSARLALCFTQKSPNDALNYITKYHHELAKHIDNNLLIILQIEILAKLGSTKKATNLLEKLQQEGRCSAAEHGRLGRIILEALGNDPVESRKSQFEQTDSLTDLAILVSELDNQKKWEDLSVYGRILYERTHSSTDAERYSNALSKLNQYDKILQFFTSEPGLILHSKTLHLIYCWSLYHEGKILECRSELNKISESSTDRNYRSLKINLAIVSADWNYLHQFLSKESDETSNTAPLELIKSAQLAVHLKSPNARNLLFAAAEKGKDDPSILANAYFLASSAGWEHEPIVGQWLERAAELSGENGPIKKMTLSDLVERRPDWDRRESEVWDSLSRGEIPMFIAAGHLNKSLISLILLPALLNPIHRDLRRKSTILSFSGKINPNPDLSRSTAGIDATTLLTLSHLNILDKALDFFETVLIPHSTMAWLLEEKQRSSFHQPSSVKNAYKVRDLLAKGSLEKFVATTAPDSELSRQIGSNLASMISEAEIETPASSRRIVIRPFPVHRIGSLMEEEADLSSHANVLASCQSIVDKLRKKGEITAEEENKYRSYLNIQERSWPTSIEIPDGSILYLDELSVSYLININCLERLKPAGLRPFISESSITHANELITYESALSGITELIERIRSSIKQRVDSGQVKIAPQRIFDSNDTGFGRDHPSQSIVGLAPLCDSVISDDRFLNKYAHCDDNGTTAPIYSTLNLLDAMTKASLLSPVHRLECRTQLRRSGFLFIPIEEEELFHHLNSSPMDGDRIQETAELKAIRESILRVRMTTLLQIPEEATWLNSTFNTLINVMNNQWNSDSPLEEKIARSEWIADQIDPQGWSHCFPLDNHDEIMKEFVMAVALSTSTPVPSSQKNIELYLEWSDQRFLEPLRRNRPDIYAAIVETRKKLLTDFLKRNN